MSDNNQELFISISQGELDLKYQENGVIQLWRCEELICEGETPQAVINYGVYNTINAYSIANPTVSKEVLVQKAEELILWEQIHGED